MEMEIIAITDSSLVTLCSMFLRPL